MAIFKDDQDRPWTIRIHVTAVEDVRETFGIDLSSMSTLGETTVKLTDDSVLLCNLLYVLCKKEADDREISDRAFGELLYGDTIDRAQLALEEAITDFFRPSQRSLLELQLKKSRQIRALGEELVAARLEDPKLTDKAMAKLSLVMDDVEERSMASITATNLPATPEASTPGQ